MFQKAIPAAIAASSLLLTAIPAMAEGTTATNLCTGLPAREQARCLDKEARTHRQSIQAEFRAARRVNQEEQQTSYFQLMTQWRKSREALQGTKKEELQNATSADERQTAIRKFREQHRSIMEQKKEDQREFREELRSEREALLKKQQTTTRTSTKNAVLQREERRRLLKQKQGDRIRFNPWWEDVEEEEEEDDDSSGGSSSESSSDDAE